MRKNTERLITGCFVMAGLFAVLAFAEWRVSKSSWKSMKYVSMYYEESSAAESAAIESEKEAEYRAEATAMTFTVPYVAPTMPETSLEIASEAMTEPTAIPETKAISSVESPRIDFTETDDKSIVETEVAVFEPKYEALSASAIMTAEEEQLIMRLASCEAGNQGWFGMALVMNVVLNRREAWGLSISDVIYAKGQFSVIGCEKWNSGFIAEEAPIALQAVKDGWDGSQGALFFCAPSGRSQWMATTRQYLFTAGGHEFYR